MANTHEQLVSDRSTPRLDWLWRIFLISLGAALLVLTFWSLGRTPPPWWDEGWTMLVARHLVQDGVYGSISVDGPQSAGMAASPANTLLVALSFRLLGIDIWQARLPAALLTLAALGLVALLARRLYSREVAVISVILLLLTTTHLTTNPLYAGRQVLGEPLQIAALLGGYAALLGAKRRPVVAWGAAMLLWGLALIAKGQTLPFWAASLALVALVALLRRQWRMAALLLGGLAGGWLSAQLLGRLIALALAGRIPLSVPISGVAEVIGFVPFAGVRERALIMIVITGLPTVCGVLWAAWHALQRWQILELEQPAELVRLLLITVAGCWLAWFMFLSIGWGRYLYPPLILAAPFSAALLYEWAAGFHPRRWLDRIARMGRGRAELGQAMAAMLTLVLVIIAAPTAIIQLRGSYEGEQNLPLAHVAQFLNTKTPPGSVVETYESELLFALHRPYHYPPDQLNATMLRRGEFGEEIPLNYDPLVANPDYLVMSHFVIGTGLYEPAIAAGHFRLIMREGWYEVYERVR